MSEEILQPAIERFAEGDLEGAVQMLDDMCKSNKDVAAVHHTYAEFANMLNVEAQDDVIPGGKIMICLLYTSPSPRDREKSRMPSSA